MNTIKKQIIMRNNRINKKIQNNTVTNNKNKLKKVVNLLFLYLKLNSVIQCQYKKLLIK